MGYNIRVQGMAPAPSSHPHYYLWTQAGGLIVDGVLFFKARVLSREGGGYETLVDEAGKTSDLAKGVEEDEDEDEELPE